MNKTWFKFACFNYSFFLVLSIYPDVFVDLEEMAQDFVLETKQIIIPDYPHAFNPSIIRWNNSLLMSFRVIPDPKYSFTSWIGLIWLDENFKPLGKPQQVRLRNEQSTVPSRAEDGRLISIGEHLYLIYTDNEDSNITKAGYRMYIAELHFDGEIFSAKNIERLSSFEGNSNDRREKNWVPFNYHDKLMLAYSLTPHRILYPVLGSTGHCETLVSSESLIDWNWGELRGGTPGLLDDNGDYLSFFHSSKRMATTHSNGKEMIHYFMGAYTFSRDFPFTITQISTQPIIGKQFYNGAEYKPYWGSVRVVFPCGFIDDKYIWIAYGRQDHEMWITKLDKKKLYASLIPVSSVDALKSYSLMLDWKYAD